MVRNRCRSLLYACVSLLALGPFASTDAGAQEIVRTNPFAARRFATLPPEANFPEGIAADPETGDIFVGTFDAAPDGTGTNFLLRFDRRGRLQAQLALGLVPVTGLAFNPRDQRVYFARPGALLGMGSFVQRVPADFDPSTPVENVVAIPDLPAPPPRSETTLDGQTISVEFPDSVPAPNGLAFSPRNGALLITDSLQGALLVVSDPSVCTADSPCPTPVSLQDPLLATAAFPQLGVNGAVILEDGRVFVTNTGDDRLLELRAGNVLAPVTESLEGADGILEGPGNTLIVSRALGDELAILDADSGRILAELGEFRGIRRDGSPRGLLFPGSITRVGDRIFASNLALPLTGSASEPELDVRTFTVSVIRIPREFRDARTSEQPETEAPTE